MSRGITDLSGRIMPAKLCRAGFALKNISRSNKTAYFFAEKLKIVLTKPLHGVMILTTIKQESYSFPHPMPRHTGQYRLIQPKIRAVFCGVARGGAKVFPRLLL
jgi:hypothetical protein